MDSGLTGSHGEIVQSRVAVVANHDQERATTQHQPMVAKIVLVIQLKQENAEKMLVQVRNPNNCSQCSLYLTKVTLIDFLSLRACIKANVNKKNALSSVEMSSNPKQFFFDSRRSVV